MEVLGILPEDFEGYRNDRQARAFGRRYRRNSRYIVRVNGLGDGNGNIIPGTEIYHIYLNLLYLNKDQQHKELIDFSLINTNGGTDGITWPPRTGWNKFSEGLEDISDPDNYPGVKIYTHPNMSGGITLPGIGIIVSTAGSKDKALLQHEYGHYLDYKFSPDLNYNLQSPSSMLNFYIGIGIPSLLNTIPGINNIPGLDGGHRTYWTETRANRWAEIWFGDKLAPDFKNRFPTKSGN